MRDLVKPAERGVPIPPTGEDIIIAIVAILCVAIVIGSVVLNLP